MSGALRRFASGVALAALVGVCMAACDKPPPQMCTGDDPNLLAAGDAGGDLVCEPPPCEDCGSFWGDPHVVTLDGLAYEFQAVGEFTVLETDEIEIQARTAPYGDSRTVSIITTVAIDTGDAVVAFEKNYDAEGWIDMYVDHEPVDVEGAFAISMGDTVAGISAAGEGVVAWPGGQMRVGVDGYWTVDIFVDVPDDAQPRGLLGDRDGDPGNDLRLRDGTELSGEALFDELYGGEGTLAESWRIAQEDSLLPYADGETTETFTDLTFPDAPPSVDDFAEDEIAAAEQACAAAGVTEPALIDSCVLDVLLLDDPDAALAAALAQERGPDGLTGAGGQPAGSGGDGWSPAWTVVLSDFEANGSSTVAATDGDSVFLSGVDGDGSGAIVAVDAAAAEEVWKVSGVLPACGPLVLESGDVLAVAAPVSPMAESGQFTLLRLDAATGDVLDAVPWEQGIHETYCRPMVSAGGVAFIADQLGRIGAWDVSATPALLWEDDSFRIEAAVATADGIVVVRAAQDGAGDELVLLDPLTGDELAVSAVRGKAIAGNLVATGDGMVIATYSGDDADASRHGTVTGFATSAAGLTPEWETVMWSADAGEADELTFAGALARLSVDGDVVVGYAGGEIVALDTVDGDVAWRFEPEGFRNTAAPPAFVDGVVYDGVFGGAFLFAVDEGAEELARIDGVPGVAGSYLYGPVAGDTLVVLGADESGTAVVGVPLVD